MNNTTHAIGLMSGTSLDGVDLVYVSFSNDHQYKIISSDTYEYSEEWRSKLQNAFFKNDTEIDRLDWEYGIFLGELILTFCKKHGITKVGFVASHGHTIFHRPDEGFTKQIGNKKSIADVCNFKVVCDFRVQDVALGGQGAPLVPIGDQLLFSDYDYCLNLGGFANVSFSKGGERIAYDICPVNIVLNHYTQKIGLAYDDKGKLSAFGKINKELLNDLNALSYYGEPIPKSLGYEFVVEYVFPLIDAYHLEINDILRTFTAHIAMQIAANMTKPGKVLVTGGGAFNTFLIEELKSLTITEIEVPENDLVNFKEAVVFALLGFLKLRNEINCLKSVTGAKKDHSSGVIFTPN